MTKNVLTVLLLLLVNYVNAQPQNLPSNAPLPWTLGGNSNAGVDSKLGTTTGVPLNLYTNNLERMRITSDGNVGIGTSTPAAKFHVNGRAQFEGGLQSNLSVNVVNLTNYYPALTSVANGDPSFYAESFSSTGRAIWAKGHVAVYAESATGTGINSSGYDYGIFGRGTAPSSSGVGSVGVGGMGFMGMWGNGTSNGVYGTGNGAGVVGASLTNSGYGVVGYGGSWAGVFFGNVYSSGNFVGSDKKLKKNISEMKSAMNVLNQLKPKLYEYREDGLFKQMNLPKGEHFGLVAQEVEQVLPNLVNETHFEPAPVIAGINSASEANGKEPLNAPSVKLNKATDVITYKAVNYTELIPIVIKGLQELSTENEELKKQVAELKVLVSKLSNGESLPNSTDKGSLLQNVPNPVQRSTSILYTLPSETKTGRLIITDNIGRTLQILQLNQSGKVDIDVSAFPAGVYNYTLEAANQKLQTRKMVVQK